MRRNIMEAKYITEKYVKYNPNKDMKTYDHISFELVGSNFGPECENLRYMD